MEPREEKCHSCGCPITISDDAQLQTVELKRFMRGITQEYHYGKFCRECFDKMVKKATRHEAC